MFERHAPILDSVGARWYTSHRRSFERPFGRKVADGGGDGDVRRESRGRPGADVRRRGAVPAPGAAAPRGAPGDRVGAGPVGAATGAGRRPRGAAGSAAGRGRRRVPVSPRPAGSSGRSRGRSRRAGCARPAARSWSGGSGGAGVDRRAGPAAAGRRAGRAWRRPWCVIGLGQLLAAAAAGRGGRPARRQSRAPAVLMVGAERTVWDVARAARARRADGARQRRAGRADRGGQRADLGRAAARSGAAGAVRLTARRTACPASPPLHVVVTLVLFVYGWGRRRQSGASSGGRGCAARSAGTPTPG